MENNLSLGGSTTSIINLWGEPERIDVNEFADRIEFVYKEVSMLSYSVYPPRPPEERVFKIIFSCVDGKWHKSERVYGEIIPAQSEQYSFDE